MVYILSLFMLSFCLMWSSYNHYFIEYHEFKTTNTEVIKGPAKHLWWRFLAKIVDGLKLLLVLLLILFRKINIFKDTNREKAP